MEKEQEFTDLSEPVYNVKHTVGIYFQRQKNITNLFDMARGTDNIMQNHYKTICLDIQSLFL